jgi:chromosome segregation ATPase
MNARLVAIFLGLIAAVLGGVLYFVKDKATKELTVAEVRVDQLTGDLVRVETKLNEQVKVNASLEASLAERTQEVVVYSNKLAYVTTELAKTEEEAKAAAAKAAEEIGLREKAIEGLSVEKDDLTERLAELNLRIGGLQAQIRETERRLAESQGGEEVLQKELRRLMSEKSDLDRRFADLSAVREQLRKLKQEAQVARRMESIRIGVLDMDKKGAQLLQEGIRRPVPREAGTVDGSLQVEIGPDGTGRVIPR